MTTEDGQVFTTTQISTHTLTWSVTFVEIPKNISDMISTHTLTWSVTYTSKKEYNLFGFQLTRSHGA